MRILIALLQGVNVGKNKRIRMADFKLLLADLGAEQTVTIANSGNAVFAYDGELDDESLRAAIEAAVTEHVGVAVPTILRTQSEIDAIVAANPYPDAVADPKTLHVDFLNTTFPDALTEIAQGDDNLTLNGREIYLFAPNRISGITYDARALGKLLGTHHTSRNWNTVINLQDTCNLIARKIAD